MNFRDLDRQGKLTVIYYLILFGVFPLYVHDKYFDIMNAKYRFYWVLGLSFIALTIIAHLTGFLKTGETGAEGVKRPEKPGKNRKQGSGHRGRKVGTNIFKNVPFYVWMLLAFWGVSIISTFTSDYFYESFWGNEGRFTGLFLMTIYVFTTIIIARKGTVLKPLLDLFLLVSAVICIFGITDFFRMDILGWHVGGDKDAVDIFYSTLGNVNTYTAYLGLTLGVASGLYAAEKKPWRMLLYYLSITLAFISLITGQSDNAYLSIGTVFAFLPLYLLKSRRGLAKFVSLFASFIISAAFVVWVSKAYEGQVIELSGMYSVLKKIPALALIGAAVLGISLLLFYYAEKKGAEEPPFKNSVTVWKGFLIAAAVCLAAVLIDANVFKHVKRYGPFGSYLYFNDHWGTNRGYGWRLGMEVYRDLPFIHKLFGYGPDTYGIMVFGYRRESMETYGYIFDAAHNEYLQYLTTIGPFGLLSYVLMQISSVREMLRRIPEKPWILGPLFAVCCYAAQSTVNISIPIAAPIMWGLLAFGLSAARTSGAETSDGEEIK